MVISLALYATIFGWAFAAGFVVLLLIHEMGHVLVAKWQGLNVSAPTFIPFMGAFISMRQMPRNSVAEAVMAAGGPVLGSLGAWGSLQLFTFTHNELFLALAYTGFFLNLFNLIPMPPLDGGRILSAASRWAPIIGLPVLGFIAFKSGNPFLFLILLFGLFEAFNRFRGGWGSVAYYDTSPLTRGLIAAGYIALVAVLALAMSDTHAALGVVRGVAS
jgi:Zn-dependent protease